MADPNHEIEIPQNPEKSTPNQFGTFGGVFTPSILTILGVIMFMRAGFVIGEAGIQSALIILLAAKMISLLTSLSVCAISTNTEVKGGGSYYLISRVLGPEFGGAVGMSMFLAQALAVPFYILGFVEALTRTFPFLEQYFFALAMGSTIILFLVAYIGAGWAIKVQYVIMTALGLAIISFLGGAIVEFDSTRFAANWNPGYTGSNNFWIIFAIYFPAVTGMDAGLNMSGDLKDPAKSIPRGILAAVGVGFLVYAVQMIICGGASPRDELINSPFDTLVGNALLGTGFLVAAGVFAATASSALGSFMGSPRILQALARDDIFPPLKIFAAGSRKGDEPRRALILSLAIGIGVLCYAGGGGEGEALNFVARIITMFFLCAYGIINLAAFVESFGLNPSFRPRFKYFHWLTALAGTGGCAWTALLIDVRGAIGAAVIMTVLFVYVRKRVLRTTFGDARRGFVYARVRNNLFNLAAMPHHAKNWRPTIIVLSGTPRARLTLVIYAEWMACKLGIVTLAEIVVGDFERLSEIRRSELERLKNFIDENDLAAFPEVAVVRDFDRGLTTMLQTHSIGPIKPNIMLVGWPRDPERAVPLAKHLQTAGKLDMSLLALIDHGLPSVQTDMRIDIWWRGQANGSLMLILAHLLTRNWEWRRGRIRILRVVEEEAGQEPAGRVLRDLAAAARIDATVKVVASSEPFKNIICRESSDASVVFLGFKTPDESEADNFYTHISDLTENLPTTLLISSSGEADLLA